MTGKGADTRIRLAVIRRFVLIREKRNGADSDLPFPAGITGTKPCRPSDRTGVICLKNKKRILIFTGTHKRSL
jgi:hypothetical protein